MFVSILVKRRFYVSALLFDLPPLQPSKIKIVVTKNIYVMFYDQNVFII